MTIKIKPNFTIKPMLVTPAMAKKWLEKNNINRPLVRASVLKWERDMREGLWLLTPDAAIMLAPDGTLLNGQHRLLALIKADMSLEMLVAFNVSREVFRVIDRGRSRTLADALRLKSGLVAVAKRLLLIATHDNMTPEPIVEKIALRIAPEFDMLLQGATGARRPYSSAAFRASVVLRLCTCGSDDEHAMICAAYKALIVNEHGLINGALRSLDSYVDKGGMKTNDHFGLLSRSAVAWTIFDPKERHHAMRIGNISQEQNLNHIGEIVRGWIAAA